MEEFLPTVRYWARHYTNRANQVLDLDDLVAVGLMGVMDAHKRYRPCEESCFKTYAEFRIRGEILDELRRQDWAGRSDRRKLKRYNRELSRLGHELGRSPTRRELGRVLPFPALEIERLALYEQGDVVCPYQEGDVDWLARDMDSVSSAVETHQQVVTLLRELPPAMRTVLEMRYYEDASVSEIAREVGLSPGRVSQLHAEALARIQKKVA